jgi:endonuclease/exonuclease/phosphatase family metal-dependent hydrolase
VTLPALADDSVRLRVATFNIRCPVDKAPNDWPSRAPRVKALIERHQFDIVGLQEATYKQLQFLLGDPEWASIGVGRADGKRGGEYSCILYRPARFELLASDTFWLSETPEVPGSSSWESANRRICTWGRFRDKISGKEFVHINTHLDHRSRNARFNGVKLILGRMDAIANGAPILFTGDFNTFPNSKTILAVRKKLHNSKALSEIAHLGPVGTFNGFSYERDRPPKREIDYIFVSEGIRVHSHRTIDDTDDGLCPSDHFPVMCEVTLP